MSKVVTVSWDGSGFAVLETLVGWAFLTLRY
jgi:hypothetical protein